MTQLRSDPHRFGAGARVGVLLALLFLVSACVGGENSGATKPALEPAVVRRHLRVGAVQRTYRLYTPPDSTNERPVPLVLALHGSGNSVDSFVDASELDDAASANGFIVAYPEALGLLWNGGFCCTSGRGSSATDVLFLDQVITDVAATRSIDPSRVYAVGVSAGGIMAYRLGCDLAARLAGVGAVAAAMVLDDCQPSRPLSVIAIHGTTESFPTTADGSPVVRPSQRLLPPPSSSDGRRWSAARAPMAPRCGER